MVRRAAITSTARHDRDKEWTRVIPSRTRVATARVRLGSSDDETRRSGRPARLYMALQKARPSQLDHSRNLQLHKELLFATTVYKRDGDAGLRHRIAVGALHRLALATRRATPPRSGRPRQVVRINLPMCVLAANVRCASAAWSSGKVREMIGRTVPSWSRGHTMAFELARDRTLLRDRPWPEGRAGQGESLEHQRLQIDLNAAPLHERDLYQAPFDRERRDVARTYGPPTMSRITSTPRPPVAAVTAGTKSSAR